MILVDFTEEKRKLAGGNSGEERAKYPCQRTEYAPSYALLWHIERTTVPIKVATRFQFNGFFRHREILIAHVEQIIDVSMANLAERGLADDNITSRLRFGIRKGTSRRHERRNLDG